MLLPNSDSPTLHSNIKLILLIVALLFLDGCASRASSPAKTATNIDLCYLLTTDEAAAALGGDIEITLHRDPRACSYDLVVTGPSNSRRYGSIVVLVVTSDSPDFQKFGVSQDARTEAKPISGVGDKAAIFMNKEMPNVGPKAIQALKGNVYVGIGMSTSTPPVSDEVLKSLATKALSRLPAL